MAHQDYFTHFELKQLLGGAKTGDPREKTPEHLQAELGLCHVIQARIERTALKISDHYHSAMGSTPGSGKRAVYLGQENPTLMTN